MQTPAEKLDRVKFLSGRSNYLYDFDQDAIRHVLAMLNEAVPHLAALSGNKEQDMWKILHDAAERGEP